MALLNDDLSVWEIAFRWAGRDPDSPWPGIPLAVRDNFRTLMDAILNGHLFCFTISLEKCGDDSESPPLFYIRDDLDAVYECINGVRFKRKLLKWARVERWECVEMVRKYAHFSSAHLAAYVDRLSSLRVVGSNGEGATIQLRAQH